MKIKYALIAAVLLVGATVTSIRAFKESTSLISADAEALAQTEYTVYGHCRYQINACSAACPHCNAPLISVPDILGPAYDVHGTCPKCNAGF